MKIEHAKFDADKGWLIGRWNSALVINIGYANVGINEPHLHVRITEVYLVARGEATMRVDQSEVNLVAGDVIMIEPNEAHTFVTSSADYFHFVIHTPAMTSDEARVDKVLL